MKKIILALNILVTFLFSFSSHFNYVPNDERVELLANENNNCDKYDSIVNITTTNNLISVSGFIVYSDSSYTYIATSLQHYNDKYNYEVIFSDYSRYAASVKGVANEDQLLLLEVKSSNRCVVEYSKSSLLDKLERVDLIGMYKYQLVQAEIFVNDIGVCKNCDEETYKKYYYSLLSGDVNDYLIGSGVFNKAGQLVGMIEERLSDYNQGLAMLDVDKIYVICYHLINSGKYDKNYIKYNLLDVNSLTKHEKYLYSLDEELTDGVLISSIHYLNYFVGGMNQGMVISKVNNVKVKNSYELDMEFSKYRKGSVVKLTVIKTSGKYKVYNVKL